MSTQLIEGLLRLILMATLVLQRKVEMKTQGCGAGGPAASPGRKAKKRGARGRFYVTTRINSEKWEIRAGIRG